MQHVDLSTADVDGHRKWIFPILFKGRWWQRRRALAYPLIAWLLIAPWLVINGKQAVFFDLIHRRIYFLGASFWVNETIIFLSFVFFLLSSILILTALLGRVFCGWACPQTVFMEFVFRPIEFFFEGSGFKQKTFLQKPLEDRSSFFLLKWACFILVAVLLGNTLVAYFFGAHRTLEMILEGPSKNAGPFITMLVASLLIVFQFGWFREQVCLFVCPYGRLQSVLLDRQSTIVAYDFVRGEPRGKPSQKTGDCVDCRLCIKTCPTGIDIRNGLQMECIHCTQCIDACDSVMQKLNKASGLIRYTTEAELAQEKLPFFRFRLVIYGFIFLATTVGLFALNLSRQEFGATLHRDSRSLVFTTDAEGLIVSEVHVQLSNRSLGSLKIRFEKVFPGDLLIENPEGVITLAPEEKAQANLILKLPRTNFLARGGLADVQLKAVDQNGQEIFLSMEMIGPAS